MKKGVYMHINVINIGYNEKMYSRPPWERDATYPWSSVTKHEQDTM